MARNRPRTAPDLLGLGHVRGDDQRAHWHADRETERLRGALHLAGQHLSNSKPDLAGRQVNEWRIEYAQHERADKNKKSGEFRSEPVRTGDKRPGW